MKRILVACAVLAVALSLGACSSGAPASGSAASSSASSAAQSASTAASSSASSAADAEGDVVVIGLEYSAGTGFEWSCSADPEGVVKQIDQTTSSLAADEDVTGGPLRDDFTFQATKPGAVVLTFELVRDWEGEPAETQTYAFTVSDDLKMVLNPYKSDFENEPEWVNS